MSLARLALVIMLLGWALGCARPSAALDPLPREVAGWTKTGATRTFTADNLSEYIDGDAERFLRAGVEKTLTADYRHTDKTEAVADVFLMGNADGARKIFEGETATGSQPVAIGNAGHSYGQTVTFQEGPYFVRVVAYQPAYALVNLAKGIDDKLR